MKVLISSFAIHPHTGSEQGVGWNWSVQASRLHDVWVITDSFHQKDIEKELRERPRPNLHFVFHEFPFEKFVWKVTDRFHPLYYPAYLVWQLTAFSKARKLHRRHCFDIAHHLTWATHRFPTFLAWLGVPFVWGPIGGGESAPRKLLPSLGVLGALGELVRDTSNLVARLDPFVRWTAGRAARIVTTSEQTRQLLPPSSAAKAEVYPAIGLDIDGLALSDEAPAGPPPGDEDTKLLFVGRLVSWKGGDFALKALACLAERGVAASLTIVGEGPEEGNLRARATELGIANRVHFLGVMPRNEVLRLYRTHDVFLFPSLHDSGGMAVLEAMYFGLPVVCLDLGGPALSVGGAGIRVECRTSEQVVEDLAMAVESLGHRGALWQELSVAGRLRAIDYDWNRKGDFIKQLYEKAAAG